jgi:hypothetical protein
MLILPLALLNLAVSALLVLALERASGLRPFLALVPASFFILAAPGTADLLLEANGNNIEPFVYVLVLWWLRRRPVAFGALLAVGVLNREFTGFALGALVVLWILDRGWRQRGIWRQVALGGLACAAVWQGVYVLKQFSSVDGPGTSLLPAAAGSGANVTAVANHMCIDASTLPLAASRIWSVHLTSLLGAAHRPMSDFGINSTLAQGANWLAPLIAVFAGAMLVRLLWLFARRQRAAWTASVAFAAYLFMIGLQSLAAYGVFKCGVVDVGTMRYGLLGLFAPIGLTAAYLACEHRSLWRGLAIAATLAIVAVSAWDHARLAREYLVAQPPNGRRVLADYLVAHGDKFAEGDYWDAYSVTFLSNERVIVASTNVSFIREYQDIISAHAAETVSIERRPCEGGTLVIGRTYVCPPQR